MDPPTTPPPPSDSDDTTTSPSSKLRLMCSHGGHIVPRPHDKFLCYVGGDTRIVVVDRHVTLLDLTKRLIKTLNNNNNNNNINNIIIKYQLPSEDLDSLISIATDEDLENMVDEYDRLNNNCSSLFSSSSGRLRLFLFPVKPESVTSIGSLLESSLKSDDWFLNALNGTTSSGFSDTSSVNCLLGLEDDVAAVVREGNKKSLVTVTASAAVSEFRSCLVSNPIVQDVQSVPDSPMMETSSSFGSASSSPPVRGANGVNNGSNVNNGDDQLKIEERFNQMSVKHSEDVNYVAAPVVPVAVTSVVNKVVEINSNPNGLNRVASEDERLETVHIAHLKQQQYQHKASGFDMISPDSVSSDGSVTNPLSRRKPQVIYQDPNSFNDQNTRIQIQQPGQQVDPQHTQRNSQPQPQPQFIHTAVPPPQYLHHQHHPSGAVSVPMAGYYQMYPSQSHQTHIRAPHAPLDQHNFVYYMPARQPPQGYNLPPLQTDPAASAPPSSQVPPPSGLFTAPRAVQTATKTDPSSGMYRTTATSGALPPQLVQVPSSQHPMQPQFVGYSHIQPPSQPVSSGGSGGNYVYEFADPAQQGQHIYYAAQPLPPQSVAQYQTMTSTLPVESQADNNMKQQVRTSQP